MKVGDLMKLKSGDLIKVKTFKSSDNKEYDTVRLVDEAEKSVKVTIDGINGYFLFSKNMVIGVVDETR